MIKGLTTAPKPCLSKILIEDLTPDVFHQGGYVDLYTDTPPNNKADNLPVINTGYVSLTFDFYLKSLYNKKFLSLIKTNLLNNYLGVKEFTSRQEFLDFLSLSEASKKEQIESQHYYPYFPVFESATKSLKKYVYNNKYLTIPFQINLNSQIENKPFLAYVFWLNSGPIPLPAVIDGVNVIPNTIIAEVVFEGGKPVTKSGYFTIGNAFGYKGEEHALFETTTFIDVEDKDPLTGNPVGSVKPTKLADQVSMYYGNPGDVWMGPIHMQQYFKPNDPNWGKFRAMGGAEHSSDSPHPFLDYNITSNNKIIDYRAASEIENIFVYNTNIYEKILASSSKVLHKGEKKKDTIDELVGDRAIFSEVNYSIRPTQRVVPGKTSDTTIVKNNIHFLFAIDKLKLIKETTTLPGFLDKLIFFSSAAAQNIVESMEIFHFEIIRINKTTGESTSLITGDNDSFFDDAETFNRLGKNISKGYQLKNKTNQIKTGDIQYISFYEFTDGEIDAGMYNNNTYTYKINLKFKDPVAEYLSNRLIQARTVIEDLDELYHKTQLKIYDISQNKFVPVFDFDQNQLNAQFVEESLNPPANPKLPLTFSFSKNDIPQSVDGAFGTMANIFDGGSWLDNLTILLITLNNYDDLIPVNDLYIPGATKIVQFIRNSLILPSTNPSLILKVRSLIALMEDRLSKALLLYTTENITKKDTGFTYKDYLKGTNPKEAKNFVIETHYTFKEDITLSRTKNYINWIFKPPHQGTDSLGMKTISVDDYKKLMTTSRNLLLSPTGEEQFSSDSSFSYSFLPIMPAWINLFNNTIPGFTLKTYKLIRKKLFDMITNNPDSVVTPEILSFHGIRFSNDSVTQIFRESATLPARMNIGSDTFDPIGKEYSPFSAVMSKTIQAPKFYSHAFGSVVNSDYEYQGGSLEAYPLILARALINILHSQNQEKFINSSFLHEKYYMKQADKLLDDPTAPLSVATLFSNKKVPFEVNLFSLPNVALSYQSDYEDSYVRAEWLKSLFNPNGYLNYDEYILYVLLVGLFGKVFYLAGFQEGEENDELTPSSWVNRKLIRSMNWTPLTKQVLDELSMAPSQQLYCKIQLFEGEEFQELFDQKIISLFKQCYNYNEYFFIQSTSAVFSIANIPSFSFKHKENMASDIDEKLEKIRITTQDIDLNRPLTPNDSADAHRAAEKEPDTSGFPPTGLTGDILGQMDKREKAAKAALSKLPKVFMQPYDDD